MRPLLLSIFLLSSLATPANAQQLKEITNSIGMRLVLIHAVSFTMGSTVDEELIMLSETSHEVTLGNSYYLGAYEVTQGEYEKVMSTNPSKFNGSKNPVEGVSWDDAVSFCEKLSDLPEEKAAGRSYRLPTEAEWEYACRASSNASYSFGDTAESLGEYAWFGEGNTHPVGEKKPNRWGLYDMHGNVLEWCQDWFDVYPPDASTDPKGPKWGTARVIRGRSCRSASRAGLNSWSRTGSIGFRVALIPSVK